MKKLVAKNFGIYSLPNIISRFIPFITLPITTKYLSLTDFGYIAIFELCIIPFQILLGFGPGYVINSMWYKLNERERGELIFSLLIVTFFIMCVAAIFIGLTAERIFSLIAGDAWGNIKSLFPFLLLAAISTIPLNIFNSWVIITKRAKLSSIVKILHIIITSSIIVLVAIYTQNYRYIIIGTVLAGVAIAFIQLFCLIRVLRASFNKRWFVLIYKISSPIFLRSIFNILRTQFDRIMVSRLFGASQFAIYNFSGKVNNMFNALSENYQNAYDPYIYKGLAEKKLDIINLRSIFFAWSYVTILFCSMLILFGEDFIRVFTNGVFVEAYPLVVLYTCVLVVILPFMGSGQVIIFFQRTKYLLMITVVQALVIIFLAVTLIPKYGPPAGIFSFWVGTLIYMLLYFYKKRQLCAGHFIEKMVLPYAVFYHCVAVLKFLKFDLIANLSALLLICAMSIHIYVVNKSTIRRIFSRIIKR